LNIARESKKKIISIVSLQNKKLAVVLLSTVNFYERDLMLVFRPLGSSPRWYVDQWLPIGDWLEVRWDGAEGTLCTVA